jgi:hypothetical protein
MPSFYLSQQTQYLLHQRKEGQRPLNTSKVKRKEEEKKEKREINKNMNIVLLSFNITII